jgi:hypothetical protein
MFSAALVGGVVVGLDQALRSLGHLCPLVGVTFFSLGLVSPPAWPHSKLHITPHLAQRAQCSHDFTGLAQRMVYAVFACKQ